MLWHGLSGQLGSALAEQAEAFNRSQPAFELNPVYKGSYAEVVNAGIAAYRQKTGPPHLLQGFEVATQSLMLSGAVLPVARVMKQQGMALDWADFIDAIGAYYSKDGRLLSMPFNVSTPILYYNRDIFRKAGLEDRPPRTWQEVEDVSRRIIAAGAARCGFTTPWPSWTLLENTFAWHDQPFATNDNGFNGLHTRLLINGAFGTMHVGALVRWQQQGIFAYAGRAMAEKVNLFADGECAMTLDSSGSIGDYKQTLPFAWGTGQLPHWGAPYPKANTILGGASLWVMRGFEPVHYRGVALFLQFISAPQQQLRWVSGTGYLPTTHAAVSALEQTSFYALEPRQATAGSQLFDRHPMANSAGLRLGNFVDVREAIELELQNIFEGRKSPREGLDMAVSRGNALLRQFSVNHGAAGQGEI